MPETDIPFDPGNVRQREERLHRFSHALKNRLGSLWQSVSMLHAMPEGPEREQLLALAEKNYFNGARELESLMDDFAVPRGNTRLERSVQPIRPLLEKGVESIAFRTAKKQQRVDLRAEEDLRVNGDPHVLGQLFEALLSNASKFSPKGAAIEVQARSGVREVLVDIRDHGVGLTDADLQEVFTRYALLDSRSTDGESQARSTLARARQWARMHGGELSASSEGTGKGALFSVRLPQA